jgi:hypothetical protein
VLVQHRLSALYLPYRNISSAPHVACVTTTNQRPVDEHMSTSASRVHLTIELTMVLNLLECSATLRHWASAVALLGLHIRFSASAASLIACLVFVARESNVSLQSFASIKAFACG